MTKSDWPAVALILAWNGGVFATAVYLAATQNLWWLLLLIFVGDVKVGKN